MSRKALFYQMLSPSCTGERIESQSFEIIDREAPLHGFSPQEWQVVRRMIHTTGDFSIMTSVRFSPDAISAGVQGLRECRPILADSNMIRAGLSLARLRTVCGSYDSSRIYCHVADDDVAAEAGRLGLPRSVIAVRKAKSVLDGAIVVLGNAPTALLELNRMIIEDGVRPALVIAAPVGFVHVEESKAELLELDVPHIVLEGRRGGSPIAVSIVHALCSVAVENQPENKPEKLPDAFDTVILLGHGSRVPGADQSMRCLEESLRKTGRYAHVTACNMSRLGPHFEETFEECVRKGARRVLVLPYFLNEGLHIKRDIPLMMQEVVRRHEGIRLVLGKNLGFDSLIVRLAEKRIEESKCLNDVRELQLPDEEAFPIPNGQYEFVPMPPDIAARWREAQQHKGQGL